MKTLTFLAAWRESSGRRRQYEETIPARYRAAHYLRCLWVPEDLEFRYCENETDARMSIARVKRLIAFMDITELKPVQHLFKLFPQAQGLPAYVDHPLVWRDCNKRYLITVEPYGMPEVLYAPPGWRAMALPPGYGIWTEPTPEGQAQTEFIWLSPEKNGVEMEVLADHLMTTLDQRRQKPTSTPH